MTRKPTPNTILDDVLTATPPAPAAIRNDAIKVDGGTQMRAHLDSATVAEYADTMADAGWGAFPPIIAYYDGSDYWLADGFHRLAAFRSIADFSDALIPADVRSGTRRDAILHAAGANASHGLRRTNADKRRAVETLLRDDEWAKWGDHEIARRCAVSQPFVGKVRSDLSDNGYQIPTERTVTRKGTTYTQNTANIGATRTLASDTLALPGKPLTVEQVAEFMAAFWPKSALQRIADAPSPPTAIRNEINTNLGFANQTCRGEYSRGMMRAWHIANGPLFDREPDETWTAFEFVTLTLQSLPPRQSPISNVKPAPATVHVLPTQGYAAQSQIEDWLTEIPATAAQLLEAAEMLAGPIWDQLFHLAAGEGYELSPVTSKAALRNAASQAAHEERKAATANPPAQPAKLTGFALRQQLVGRTITDAYNLPGSVSLVLDTGQTITINGSGLHFTSATAAQSPISQSPNLPISPSAPPWTDADEESHQCLMTEWDGRSWATLAKLAYTCATSADAPCTITPAVARRLAADCPTADDKASLLMTAERLERAA